MVRAGPADKSETSPRVPARRPDHSERQKQMSTTNANQSNRAEDQARMQLACIKEMLAACDKEQAAAAFAETLTREQCTELLKDSGFVHSDDAPLEDLRELVADGICDRFGSIEPDDFEFDEDAARQTIQEDPLSVEVRSGWQTVGEELTAAEYCILLCTGGPAVRIIGDLNRHNEPERARLQFQDWGTPWTDLVCTGEDYDALIAYAGHFYFGE